MSDDGNGGLHVRQSPRTRNGDVHITDFTSIVRVPGQAAAVRVYTEAEIDDAARYAAETGGVVVRLPLSPPAGYTNGSDGSLVPAAPGIIGR